MNRSDTTAVCAASIVACLALNLAGCTPHQHLSLPAAQTAQPIAKGSDARHTSHDFVGEWTCQVWNGTRIVVEIRTIRADGTTVGGETAFGNTTPAYENSWSYTPSGSATGTMRASNAAFAPPHYSQTSSVTWQTLDRFRMITPMDYPFSAAVLRSKSVKAIGSTTVCVRRYPS